LLHDFFSLKVIADILKSIGNGSFYSWMFKFFWLCRYVVDAADRENMAIAKGELHDLLSKPSLTGIPLLVIGNKVDKPEAFPKQSFTEVM